jgi:hypothetical protein
VRPISLRDIEPVLLERRPDLQGAPLTPWHLIAPRLGPAFDVLAREEQVRQVVDAIDAIEPRTPRP